MKFIDFWYDLLMSKTVTADDNKLFNLLESAYNQGAIDARSNNKHKINCYDYHGKLCFSFDSIKQAAKYFKCNRDSIWKSIVENRSMRNGFKFEYIIKPKTK